LLLLFVSAISVCAQQRVRLNDNWQFMRQDLGGIWEAVRGVEPGSPESVPLWENVTLPHCVNAVDGVHPDLNYYQGPSWYRTRLKVSNPYENGRTLLHFEGAGQKTSVFVYTTEVKTHVGGYDEWTADITEAVEAFKKTDICKKVFNGEVPVSIRTDNSRDLEMIPSDLSDFNIYGGLYRYVNLVYAPALSVDRVFALAEVDKTGRNARLQVKARFYNPDQAASADVEVKLLDEKGRIVERESLNVPFQDGSISLTDWQLKNPQVWSTVRPSLYTVEVSIHTANGESKHSEKVGFRHFEFIEKGPFMLNGKRLLLRGTHRHEDHAGVAAAMTEDMIRTEMKMMKDMGVNFIRLGHYQQSRIVLDLCDSLGILVWEEIPWCRGGLGGDIYKDQARRMLINMIEQHYNHASVIIWGLGNENDWPGDFSEFDKEKIRVFMKELNDLSHKLDNSRKTAIRRCDFCSDIVDVYSPSIWAGWYRGVYTEYKQVSEAEFKKYKHFLHVEWGGDSHARRHSENPDNALMKVQAAGEADERAGDASLYGGSTRVSKDGDWSESYICNLVDWHLKEQETMPWLTGTAQWPFKDFSTPVRPDNPVPYMNQKGVVERDFTKKEVFYVYQSYWTDKPMAHIYGHSWPVRWGEPGEDKMIKVYSNCDEAELFLNGKSQGVKLRNSQDFPAAGLRWNLNFIAGENDVKVIARKGKVTVTDSKSFRYETAKWSVPARMMLTKIEDRDGIQTLEARIVDENNVPCLDARNWVRFSLSGDGELIENQGTSSGSSFLQMYNGRAIIRVKSTKGKYVIAVKSEGIPTVSLNL